MDNERFTNHIFHSIEVVLYGNNWAVECAECHEIILDQEVWEMLAPKEEQSND